MTPALWNFSEYSSDLVPPSLPQHYFHFIIFYRNLFLLVIWCSASCVHPNFSWSYFCAFIRALSSLSRFFLTKIWTSLSTFYKMHILDHETSFAFLNRHRVVGAVAFKTEIWSNDAVQPICTFFPPKVCTHKSRTGN